MEKGGSRSLVRAVASAASLTDTFYSLSGRDVDCRRPPLVWPRVRERHVPCALARGTVGTVLDTVSRLNNTLSYLVCDMKCTLMTYLYIEIAEMPLVGKIATSIERARDCGVRVLDVIAVIVWLPGTPLCHGSREHGTKGYQ